MANIFNIGDRNGSNLRTRTKPVAVNNKALAADVAERDTVPAGVNFVIINGTGNYWVKVGDVTVTAAKGSDVSDGTGSEIGPSSYTLESADTHISVISNTASEVSLAYYLIDTM